MRDECERCERETQALLDEASRFLAALDRDRLNRAPQPGVWSAARCLDHLSLTAERFHASALEAVAEAHRRRRLGGKPYRPGVIGRWLLRSMEPGGRMRARATAEFSPAAERRSRAEVEARFGRAHRRFLELLPALEPVDLGRARIRSPFLSVVTYPLGFLLLLVPAHGRRHLAPARRAAGS